MRCDRNSNFSHFWLARKKLLHAMTTTWRQRIQSSTAASWISSGLTGSARAQVMDSCISALTDFEDSGKESRLYHFLPREGAAPFNIPAWPYSYYEVTSKCGSSLQPTQQRLRPSSRGKAPPRCSFFLSCARAFPAFREVHFMLRAAQLSEPCTSKGQRCCQPKASRALVPRISVVDGVCEVIRQSDQPWFLFRQQLPSTED